MSGLYLKGEQKVRPGVYRRHEKVSGSTVAGAMSGVFCIPVHADFGPVGEVKKITTRTELEETFMNSGTVEAAERLFSAGANTVYVYRLGSGGKEASLTLKTTDASADGVTLKTLYPTALKFTVTLKQKLGDETTKECCIYLDSTLVEKISFAAGSGQNEVANLVAAAKGSKYVTATAVASKSSLLQAVTQQAMAGGTAPTVVNGDYSTAFSAFEAYAWNVLALDTVAEDVKALAKTYMDRIHDNGSLGICIMGEGNTRTLEQRIAAAKSYNAPYIVYCGSGYNDAAGDKVDDYLAVATQAGLIGSKDSSNSIVHTEIPNAYSCVEKFTDQQYIEAIKAGLLLLSEGPDGQVWFDSGVNTYTVLADNDDEGWKKIKRTAIRYEAFDRIDRTLAPLVGKIANDADGVDNVIQQAKKVLEEMYREKKILDTYDFYEDTDNPHAADYAYFVIQIDDVDSMEKIYLKYVFQYIPE